MSAQQPYPELFYTEIQLRHQAYSLDELTREIQQQSGITFSYNTAKINAKRRIHIKETKMTVEKLLVLIKKRAGVDYRVIGNNHIIYRAIKGPQKKKRKKSARKPKSQIGVVAKKADKRQTELPLSEREHTVQQEPVQIAVIGDTAVAATYYLSAGVAGGGGAALQMIPKYPDDKYSWRDPYSRLDSPGGSVERYDPGSSNENTFLKKSGLLRIGLSADEIFYFNPTVCFGFTFLHAILSYDIGSFPQWRYGVGTAVKISSKWSLHFSYNTGNYLYKQFTYPLFDTIVVPPPDSITPPQIIVAQRDLPVEIKSKLDRFMFSVMWDMNGNFSLAAGLVLNHLKTSYFSSGSPFSFSSVSSQIPDADNRFRTIKPPYLLSNTYDPISTSSIKVWLGLQVVLLYRIPFF